MSVGSKNPYRPGVGTRPVHLAGRDAAIGRFKAALRGAPEQPANMRLTGLRGVGKTVLLTEFRAHAEDADWVTIQVELQPGHNTDEALIALLDRLGQRARERISKAARVRSAVGGVLKKAGKIGVTWNEVTFSLDPGDENASDDLLQSLFTTTETAVNMGYTGLLLLLDEAQSIRDDRAARGDHPLSILITAVSTLQRLNVPIGLVLCGLPTLTGNLLRARSYTERMFRGEEVASLDPDDARDALTRPLQSTGRTATKSLVEEVLADVEGYPYFIQLWGAELWDAAEDAGTDMLTVAHLSSIRPDIFRRLDSDFYDPRLETLTPAEQDLMLATAACDYPPVLVPDLNRAVDKTPGNINVLLGRLVDAGVLYRLRKGQYDYTAPKFREYIVRRAKRPADPRRKPPSAAALLEAQLPIEFRWMDRPPMDS